MKFQLLVLITLSTLVSCKEINLGNLRGAYVNTTGGTGGGGGGGGSCSYTNSANSGQFTLGKNRYFFSQVGGVAFDSSGNMYTTNQSPTPKGFLVMKHSSAGAFLGEFITNGAGAEEMSGPTDMVIDSNNHLFIVDSGNGRIQKYDTFGNHLLTITPPYPPRDIDILSSGDIIVATNDTLLVYGPDGSVKPSIGTAGTNDGEFTYATSVRVISNGNIYVLDGNRIQILDSTGNYLSQFTLPLDAGLPQYAETFEVLDNGTIYIPRRIAGAMATIDYFSSTGTLQGNFGSVGTSDNNFNISIRSLRVGTAGIYIGDAANLTLWQPNGTFIRRLTSKGTANSEFHFPTDVKIDASGNILVLDMGNKRIQKFSSTGTHLSNISVSFMGSPIGLSLDSAGNFYVADQTTMQIEKISSTGTHLGTIGAGDFGVIQKVLTDKNNNIYGLDLIGDIKKYNSAGVLIKTVGSAGSGPGQFSSALHMATDSNNNLYVADAGNNRIQKFDSNSDYVSEFTYSGMFPSMVASAPCGDIIYVVDFMTGSILKFDGDGNFELEQPNVANPTRVLAGTLARDGSLIIIDGLSDIAKKLPAF